MDEEKELERVLVIAENSESMDAIRLAAEVRRLRSIESSLKNAIAWKLTQAGALRLSAAMLSREGKNTASIYTLAEATDLSVGATEMDRILEGKDIA